MFAKQLPDEPADQAAFTRRFDDFYSQFAGAYAWAVKYLPVWKTWLRTTLPHIEGERVLEVSFGTGYLLSQYGARHHCIGLDYNARMVATAGTHLQEDGLKVPLVQGDVAHLPFPDASFDCLVNTMAFSGYPDGAAAMGELRRVLRDDGRLVMLDIAYPKRKRPFGVGIVNLWKLSGDLPRDMPALFERTGFEFSDEEIGGFGSVHLYLARKRG
jgi:ubiquinone/menaquinone biosynthesis C-methylase UbiE